VEVFLDFISYSGGPLPEELLPRVACPVSILWGEADPWEPIAKGRAYADFDCVEEFVPLPGVWGYFHCVPACTLLALHHEHMLYHAGVGHCPMDEAPELVNPLTLAFIERHSALKAVD
jgi:pimeloyl-ACP methyl ester carboxylesterase